MWAAGLITPELFSFHGAICGTKECTPLPQPLLAVLLSFATPFSRSQASSGAKIRTVLAMTSAPSPRRRSPASSTTPQTTSGNISSTACAISCTLYCASAPLATSSGCGPASSLGSSPTVRSIGSSHGRRYQFHTSTSSPEQGFIIAAAFFKDALVFSKIP